MAEGGQKAPSYRILVVEDDAGYQELLPLLLPAPDYDLTVCASAEEALGKLDAQVFDMILSDINLLGMSGFEVLTKIKQAGLLEKCPVLMCSSQFDPATKDRAAAAGAAGFVTKPYQAEGLRQLIAALVRR